MKLKGDLIIKLHAKKTEFINDKNIRLLIESTIKALITKFNNSPIKMIENVVNSSIENNWVGLFWNKYEEAKEDSNTSPLSSKPLN